MGNRNIVRWGLLGLLICLLEVAPAHAFYNPQQGRWLSRDPIAERGGKNLYNFVGNVPIQTFLPPLSMNLVPQQKRMDAILDIM
jgi:hypothetical protein